MENILKENIIDFIAKNNMEYNCTQPKLSVPVINRIYKKMVVGINFSSIKVANGLICNGHHRYVASKLANYELEIIPTTLTSATNVTNWPLIIFDEEDWDTKAKIDMLNEQDAAFNNIKLEKIIKILK